MENYYLTIEGMLKEDLGKGDVTTDAILGDEEGLAAIIALEPCILAGMEDALEVFQCTGANVRYLVDDGTEVEPLEVVLVVDGSLKSILMGERLALNLIGRMSGIATATREMVKRAKMVNPKVEIYATRKTTPGFRWYEKRAVIAGGGQPHRFGLYDAMLIKDNHIFAAGGVEAAVEAALASGYEGVIEVEVESLEDAVMVAKKGVDIILLDNMTPEEAGEAYEAIKAANAGVEVEVSGGITLDNVADYANAADRISSGFITHSARSMNFTLKLL